MTKVRKNLSYEGGVAWEEDHVGEGGDEKGMKRMMGEEGGGGGSCETPKSTKKGKRVKGGAPY